MARGYITMQDLVHRDATNFSCYAVALTRRSPGQSEPTSSR
jgi:hypothetical protein